MHLVGPVLLRAVLPLWIPQRVCMENLGQVVPALHVSKAGCLIPLEDKG